MSYYQVVMHGFILLAGLASLSTFQKVICLSAFHCITGVHKTFEILDLIFCTACLIYIQKELYLLHIGFVQPAAYNIRFLKRTNDR